MLLNTKCKPRNSLPFKGGSADFGYLQTGIPTGSRHGDFIWSVFLILIRPGGVHWSYLQYGTHISVWSPAKPIFTNLVSAHYCQVTFVPIEINTLLDETTILESKTGLYFDAFFLFEDGWKGRFMVTSAGSWNWRERCGSDLKNTNGWQQKHGSLKKEMSHFPWHPAIPPEVNGVWMVSFWGPNTFLESVWMIRVWKHHVFFVQPWFLCFL